MPRSIYSQKEFEKDLSQLEKFIQKKQRGGAKKEYTGTYRHFTLHYVNGKEVEIGNADIKDHQTPLSAAKKLLSSYCRHEGIKSNERNKVNITFTIRETTRGHSKIYGPYKGKFVKYDKPVIIKLKNGKVIKRTVNPMVKLLKENTNKKMVGGDKLDKSKINQSKYTVLDNTNLYDHIELYYSGTFIGKTYNSFFQLSTGIKLRKRSQNYNKDIIIWQNTFDKFTALETLDLSSIDITYIYPRNFNENLKTLKYLYLNNNKIENLDNNLFEKLVNLKKLHLNNNQIENLNPNLFKNLKNLEVLHLNYNKIKNLNENFFEKLVNLKELHLNNNLIENLNEKIFENLYNLKELRLNNNQIKNLNPNLFKNLKNLEVLDLNNNLIENLNEKLFEKLENLKELHLDYNQIEKLDKNVFKNLSKLKILKLNNNIIKNLDEKLFEFKEIKSGLVYLNELYLNNNNIEELPKNLFNKSLRDLKILHLNNNNIKNLVKDLFINLVNLDILDLSNNNSMEIEKNTFKNIEKEKIKISVKYNGSYKKQKGFLGFSF